MIQSGQTRLTLTRRKQMLIRRCVGLALLIVGILTTGWLTRVLSVQLQHPGWVTGYLLIGCLYFLAAFNLRKKLPGLPRLGSNRFWMQCHIYVAWFSVAIFLMHTGLAIPEGGLERFLAGLYGIVAGSGIYGLIATRTIPRRLTALDREFIFEEVPAHKRQLIDRVRRLVLGSAQKSDVVARFYVNRLISFFEQPRSWSYQLAPSARHSKELIREIEDLDRYLSPDERDKTRQLARMVQEKEDLDYHWALQGRLKLWMFIHVGLTYGLLIVATLHGILAHAFAGGMR